MSVAAIARMASPKPLDEKAARRLDSDDWVDELRELPAKITDENRVQAVAGIKALLRLTRSSRVRNAAALALTDIVEAEAATAIATVLRRPELATSAGTLLFALNDVGASLPLDLIVSLVENGSLETRAEATTFLEEGRIEPVLRADLENARTRLSALTLSVDKPTADAANLALEYLDDVPTRHELSA